MYYTNIIEKKNVFLSKNNQFHQNFVSKPFKINDYLIIFMKLIYIDKHLEVNKLR